MRMKPYPEDHFTGKVITKPEDERHIITTQATLDKIQALLAAEYNLANTTSTTSTQTTESLVDTSHNLTNIPQENNSVLTAYSNLQTTRENKVEQEKTLVLYSDRSEKEEWSFIIDHLSGKIAVGQQRVNLTTFRRDYFNTSPPSCDGLVYLLEAKKLTHNNSQSYETELNLDSPTLGQLVETLSKSTGPTLIIVDSVESYCEWRIGGSFNEARSKQIRMRELEQSIFPSLEAAVHNTLPNRSELGFCLFKDKETFSKELVKFIEKIGTPSVDNKKTCKP